MLASVTPVLPCSSISVTLLLVFNAPSRRTTSLSLTFLFDHSILRTSLRLLSTLCRRGRSVETCAA